MNEETEKHHITFTSGYCEPVDFDQWLGKQRRKPNDIDRIVSAFRNFLETNYVSGESEGRLLGLKSIEIVHDEGFDTITLNIKDYDYETEEEDSE